MQAIFAPLTRISKYALQHHRPLKRSVPASVPLATGYPTRRYLWTGPEALTEEETFAHYGGMAKKPNEALYIKCHVFGIDARIPKALQSFGRSDFCTEHGLQFRDLRKIDTSVENSVPTILIRPGSILVNVHYIRILIKSNVVYLFEQVAPAHATQLRFFVHALETIVGSSSADAMLPFEFRVLEAALGNIVGTLETEYQITRKRTTDLLESLERKIDADNLRRLLDISRQLMIVQKRVTVMRELIDELLESQDDMASMYLTEAAAGRPRDARSVTEIEQLLESWSTQVEETENYVSALVANIQASRDVIELILDSSRNALLALDLKISILTASMTAGALFAAFFGMNLHSGYEEHHAAFYVAASFATFIAFGSASVMLVRLRRLRQIGLGTASFGSLPYARQSGRLPGAPPTVEHRGAIMRPRKSRWT